MKQFKRALVIGALMVVVLSVGLVACSPAVAYVAPDGGLDPDQVGDVPGLVDVLKLMAEGVGVGAVIAFLFERFKWFQGLGSDQRWWVIFGLSLGLPLAAQILLQFVPAEAWMALAPYWHTLAAGFLTWTGTQMAHFVRKRLTAS